ncbi:MAG: ATP-binding protein, partial [Candidatus Bathyarchaeia archaeon]
IETIHAKGLLEKFKRIYLFLDEVQRIEGWERFVRSIYDEFKGKIKIFVSGSTSKLTQSKLSSLLSGRHLTTFVFPLSFIEFLGFRGFEMPKVFIEEDRARVMAYLKEYIEFGGFPEIVLNEKKEEMLETLMLDIINRDILPKIGKRKEVIEDLAYLLCSNSGKLLSFNKIARILERRAIKLSVPSTEKFFMIMKDALLFFDITIFSYSVRNQILYPRKIYCIDTGFVNFFGFKFSEDRGRLMENLVAIELARRKSFIPILETYYWKSRQEEVDFVIKEGLDIKQLIQVTYASGRDDVERREIKALIKASQELKCKDLLVITWDYEDEQKFENRKVVFKPLWRWLLEKNFSHKL